MLWWKCYYAYPMWGIICLDGKVVNDLKGPMVISLELPYVINHISDDYGV